MKLLLVLFCAATVYAQSPEARAVNAAAEALGGKAKLLALRSLTIYGYGQLAYQDGGGNVTSSPDAPQKWANIRDSKRTIDLASSRMRLEQRQYQDFVFAYAANMTGAQRANQILDGNIAFNVSSNGQAQRVNDAAARQRRIDMLDNPVVLIRTALDAKSKLANLRQDGGRQVIDLTTPAGDAIIFAMDAATNLPAWMQWTAPHANYGDVTYRTTYSGYQDEQGIRLPYGYNTVMDFRNIVYRKFYADRYGINDPTGDLAAPAAIRSATAPAAPAYTIEAIPVAKGIWYMKGGAGNSSLYEFADHLTLFECYGNEASTLAIIAKARATVPGKPVTQCIVGHHHIDHSGGARAAVSEGLELVTHRGNVDYFKEVIARPAKLFPDALGRNPKPLKILAVDEHLKLKDSAMEVDLYRAISNSHMANGLFAHVPGLNLVSQGDFTDETWDQSFWANTYPASVAYWKLTVDRDLSVHGNMHTYAEVLDQLRAQIKGAQALCAKADAAGLPLQGCPVVNLVQ
jgi:hypothetical protein